MSRNKIADIVRGLREVAHYIVKKGETLPTAFTEEKPKKDETVSQDDTNAKPRPRFDEESILILDAEPRRQIKAVFDNPTNITACTVPCYFNNESANIEVYVFPRVVKQGEQPVVQPRITVSVRDKNTEDELACAIYNADEYARFERDVHDVSQESLSREQLQKAMLEQFGAHVHVPDDSVLTRADMTQEDAKENVNEIN